jgi:hypothetical protein
MFDIRPELFPQNIFTLIPVVCKGIELSKIILVVSQRSGFRTISDFRKQHLKALSDRSLMRKPVKVQDLTALLHTILDTSPTTT